MKNKIYLFIYLFILLIYSLTPESRIKHWFNFFYLLFNYIEKNMWTRNKMNLIYLFIH